MFNKHENVLKPKSIMFFLWWRLMSTVNKSQKYLQPIIQIKGNVPSLCHMRHHTRSWGRRDRIGRDSKPCSAKSGGYISLSRHPQVSHEKSLLLSIILVGAPIYLGSFSSPIYPKQPGPFFSLLRWPSPGRTFHSHFQAHQGRHRLIEA